MSEDRDLSEMSDEGGYSDSEISKEDENFEN